AGPDRASAGFRPSPAPRTPAAMSAAGMPSTTRADTLRRPRRRPFPAALAQREALAGGVPGIVTTAVALVPRLAAPSGGTLSASRIVSGPSPAASLVIVSVNVLNRSAGPNVSVPVEGWKSVPGVAVP